MQKFTQSDFSGGIQESLVPEDFSPSQSTILSGFMPISSTIMQTQPPLQQIGSKSQNWRDHNGELNYSYVKSIYPLQSTAGIFLVAIKQDGSVWWTKDAANTASHTVTNGLTWTELYLAENKGFAWSPTNDYTKHVPGSQPDITLERNPDYKFICDIPFEVYKYKKQPSSLAIKNTVADIHGSKADGYAHRFDYDELPDSITNSNFDIPQDVSNVTYTVSTNECQVTIESYDDINSYFKIGDLIQLTGTGTTLDNTDTTPYTVTSVTYDDTIYTGIVTFNTSHGTDENIDLAYGHLLRLSNNVNGILKSTTSGVLVNSRRFYNGGKITRTKNILTGTYNTTEMQFVAYVDPYMNSGNGGVKFCTFPNIRRYPMFTRDNPPTYSSRFDVAKPWVLQSNKTAGQYAFIDTYPFVSTNLTSKFWTTDVTHPSGSTSVSYPSTAALKSSYPKFENMFHPYSYLDNFLLGLPGIGNIPRANVGVSWGHTLVLGDLEYRSEAANTYKKDSKLTPRSNTAFFGNGNGTGGLRDGNTEPHRGWLAYSEEDIDIWDPRSYLPVSGSDARITGMHVLNNKLICITSAGGENDGVITFTGNFNLLHSNKAGNTANPNAIIKQVIKGGVGTLDIPDNQYAFQNNKSVLWAEAGVVAFIDHNGGVYYTNGVSTGRLDTHGIIPESKTLPGDCIAAVGKYLFVLRNLRLLCYTLFDTNSGNLNGAWTEVIGPLQANYSYPDNSYRWVNIRSLIGSGNNLYIHGSNSYNFRNTDGTFTTPVQLGDSVWRLALSGPVADYGKSDSYQYFSVFGTKVFGAPSQHLKLYWQRMGITFYTPTQTIISTTQVNTGSPIQNYVPGVEYSNFGEANYVQLFRNPNKTYTEGIHNFESTVGLGTSKQLSAMFYFKGFVRLQGLSIYYTGATESVGAKLDE